MTPAEFTSIAPSLRPRLLALGRSFFSDAEAAEDAVQEAMMKLWKVWEQLPSATDAERLAVRLTKHSCISGMRSQHKGQIVPLEARQATDITSSAAASDSLYEREVREAVAHAIEQLRPSERRLWMMFAEAQMDATQIASATGIGVRTVSSMLSTARNKIKNELKKGGIL